MIYLPISESRVVVLFDPEDWNPPGNYDSAFVGVVRKFGSNDNGLGWLNG